MVVKKELSAAGVRPAINPKTVGATFYRRSGSPEKVATSIDY